MLHLLKNIFSIKSISGIALQSTEHSKMVLLVRADIKMTKGKIAAQCSHASIACYERSQVVNPEILKEWIKSGQPKIVLKVDNFDELNLIYKQANQLNIVSEVVKDAGRTQLSPGTITVLGLGPDSKDKIDKLVKNLKLL